MFELGLTYIESLHKAPTRFDFAILILTLDDLVQSRSTESASPRDNVVLELGLFMGGLGRDRTFVLQQSASALKIPSDLMGVMTALYDWPRNDTSYGSAVATASETIRERIQSLGKRKDSLFAGLDPSLVTEKDGILSAKVSGWQINAVIGRNENHPTSNQTAIVLPCNKYFDDECASDNRSALGAYVNKAFPGRAREFMDLVKAECQLRLGAGKQQEKKDQEHACSF